MYVKFKIFVLYFIFIFSVLFNIYHCERSKQTTQDEEIKIDTIFKRDTIIFTQPEIICIGSKTKIDTVELKLAGDTIYKQVEIPIETKEYKDSLYYCRISGFQPILEHLEVYPVQTTIEKKITQYRAKKWGYGIQAGFGYGIINKKPDLYIGVGINYNIK